MLSFSTLDRRQFLRTCMLTAASCVLPPALDAIASVPDKKYIAFHNTHTEENLRLCYSQNGRYRPEALSSVNHIMRDFRTGEVKDIDPALLDLLHAMAHKLGTDRPFQIISGYRSPATNAMLRRRSKNVAKHSLHTVGQAVDIRLPGIKTSLLHRVAMNMKVGGVGYYPESDFVHVDTGRVRYW